MTAGNIAAGVPICGFTGINGAGKTLLAVHCAIRDMLDGRTVYSTVPIAYGALEAEPVLSLRQLLEVRDATVLLDDVSVIFSSRSTNSLPHEVVTLLQTVRHHRMTILWTAPGWMRADVLLRSVTQGLVSVAPMFRTSDRNDPWPRPRLVRAGLLDTSSGKVDAQPDKVLRRRLYLPKKLLSFGAYDTHADTPILGHAAASGVCVDCGGSQERPKHNQARHEALGIPFYPEPGKPQIEGSTPIASGIRGVGVGQGLDPEGIASAPFTDDHGAGTLSGRGGDRT